MCTRGDGVGVGVGGGACTITKGSGASAGGVPAVRGRGIVSGSRSAVCVSVFSVGPAIVASFESSSETWGSARGGGGADESLWGTRPIRAVAGGLDGMRAGGLDGMREGERDGERSGGRDGGRVPYG